MAIRSQIDYFLFGILPPIAVACRFVGVNLYPHNEWDLPLFPTRCYGFPFAYRYDKVVNWQNVFGDGGTVEDPRAPIIWDTTFDQVALIADVAAGIFSTLIAWGVSYLFCQVCGEYAKIIMGTSGPIVSKRSL